MEKMGLPHAKGSLAMHLSPRCLAKTRAGGKCMMPAMRDKKRCRLHGGKATGRPKKHGRYSKSVIVLEKSISTLVGQCTANLIELEKKQG